MMTTVLFAYQTLAWVPPIGRVPDLLPLLLSFIRRVCSGYALGRVENSVGMGPVEARVRPVGL